MVFQEVLLFNRSIGENLRVGKPDATDEEMRDAAARAQALDFIESNPEGFEASVGERGRMLSGGERQRISIARALLKNPPILILDEATSALDATTEMKVQAALDEVMKDRTTFVIAHRLSTVRNATRILVFEHGRIVESGTLRRTGPPRRRLRRAGQGAVPGRRDRSGQRPTRAAAERHRAAADGSRTPAGVAVLLDPLQHADVIRHRRAAHVEDAGELGVLHLDVAGACRQAAWRRARASTRRSRRSDGPWPSGRRTD